MQDLELIDIELKKQFEKLSELTKTIEFKEIAQFKIDGAAEKIPWDQITYPGLYLLEIKNDGKFKSFDTWVKHFKNEWENEEYLKKSTPNLKKLRIRAHSDLGDWVPLYIEQSRNIGSRIHGHIYKELHKTTFALKLMARKNLKDDLFRLKAIEISVDNYDSIVPRIEWQLRNRLNPLIGKQ